jgi:hypothetical protein
VGSSNDYKQFGKQPDGTFVYPPHPEFWSMNESMHSVENVSVTVQGKVSN